MYFLISKFEKKIKIDQTYTVDTLNSEIKIKITHTINTKYTIQINTDNF
jgi:hypothetical protein